jgi:hypothetical protein
VDRAQLQCVDLEYDEPLSKFIFDSDLRPYTKVNRLIVNKNAPENRMLPGRKMDIDSLPHADLTFTFDSCAVVGNGGRASHSSPPPDQLWRCCP